MDDYTTGRVSRRYVVLWESLVSMIEGYPWMGVNLHLVGMR